jgi:hypothetical protein
MWLASFCGIRMHLLKSAVMASLPSVLGGVAHTIFVAAVLLPTSAKRPSGEHKIKYLPPFGPGLPDLSDVPI